MGVTVFQVDPLAALEPYEPERAAVKAAGGTFVIGACKSEADVVEQAGDAEILLVTWQPFVTPKVMDQLPNVRLIVRWGVGYDQIDAVEAEKRGIAVANLTSFCTDDVAELAVSLLLSAARRVTWMHEGMRAGGWTPFKENRTARLRGRTLGIIGLGRIGSAVAWRAKGLGLKVIAHDPYLSDEEIRARQAEPRTMDALLAEADFVSVHTPLNPETRGLIGAEALAKMKPGAVLVNSARGPIVDEAALIEALKSGKIGAAALDVYEVEPLPEGHPLRSLPNVVLTPHCASWTNEAWEDMRSEMAAVMTEWIGTSWCHSVVNPGVRGKLRERRVPVA